MVIRRLTRSRTAGKIGGVCAGIARYFDVDVVLVRAAWVVFSVVPGAIIGGVVVYLAAWMLIPEGTDPEPAMDGRWLTLSATDKKILGVCGGLGRYFGIDPTLVRLVWVILSVLCAAVIGGVIAYIVAWLIIPRRHDGVSSTLMTAVPPA